jgi:hypothetical protein
MPANREPLHEASDRNSYSYRRSLSTRELAMAAGVAVGAGLFAFYVATRFAQRTPLLDRRAGGLPRRPRVKGPQG